MVSVNTGGGSEGAADTEVSNMEITLLDHTPELGHKELHYPNLKKLEDTSKINLGTVG